MQILTLLAAVDGKSREIKLFMRDYDYEMMVMAAQALDLKICIVFELT